MKKLLITGGSHGEVPLIDAAQKMGWYVISLGNDEGAQGHEIADQYIKGDFSDKDLVFELAKREQVEAIVSGCNDFAYLSAAYACEKLGLPGHDTYETSKLIHIKSNFRKVTDSIGIPSPRMEICSSKEQCKRAAERIGFPLLIKPVDLTGGKGVRKCMDVTETLEAFEEAMKVTRERFVIAEEFIQGENHGITTLIKNERVVFYMIDDEQYGLNKYLVAGACSPSSIPQHAEFTLIRDIERVAGQLKLVDGVFHVQFILDRNGYPVLIDPCRRAPGDLYVLLAKYTTGMDYPAEIVKAECGESLQNVYSTEHNFVARECVMSSKNGIIRKIHMKDELRRHLVYMLLRGLEGDEIEDFMKYKAAILIMKFDDYTGMRSVLDRFGELAWIELEEGLNGI